MTTRIGRCRLLPPWVAIRLAPYRPAVAEFTFPLRGGLITQILARVGVFNLREPGGSTTDTPCRTSHSAQKLGNREEDQDLFHQHLAKDGSFQCPKCLLPISPFMLCTNLRRRFTFGAATGVLALPPGTQLPTWVYAYEVCARPERLYGC